ncbi:MAG: RNA polymerase sigma factor [Candidatus Riflebacteria bacterium]|nr:RNA polymerase sigma factor [Candidatus Riflebacteria bacterium]
MSQKPIDDLDVKALIKRIIEGETDLFLSLVNRFSPLAHHFFFNRTGRNLEATHDLMQEAFTKAFVNLHTFRLDGSFSAWFMTICRNLAINQFHRRKLEEYHLQDDRCEEKNGDFSNDLIKKEEVQKAMSHLTDVQRQVVEMKYFWDLNCKEIGKALNIPEGSIKSHLFYARLRLLEVLGEN